MTAAIRTLQPPDMISEARGCSASRTHIRRRVFDHPPSMAARSVIAASNSACALAVPPPVHRGPSAGLSPRAGTSRVIPCRMTPGYSLRRVPDDSTPR